ncbi:MAG: GNAT family N-acetyltransferase [Ruminococcus sp.]|nr:GNAT family N-acetyltransferase [Ruminococcus sp.]
MIRITENDIEEIAESYISVFNSEPWNDSWTKEQAVERLTDFFRTPKFEGVMERADGKIAAVLLGRGETYFDGIHFQILEFWVDKAMQRQGIGGRLLEEFIEYLKFKGIYHHFLITLHGECTEGFYEKHGFKADDFLCLMQKHEI